jgi:TATA-binding protein-associated factor Taf7
MSKKSDKLRSDLVSKVWNFLESRGITTLEAYEVDAGGSPVVCFDPSTLEDHFTLDRLVVDKEYGKITVEGSNTYSNDDWDINDIPLECLEELAEWLEDNEEAIGEIVSEEEDGDEELSDEDCEIIDKIEELFGKLSSYGKVSVMCSLYYDMYDGEKDQFLRDTENG